MEFVLQRLENKSRSLPLQISLYRAELGGVVGTDELASYSGSLGLLSTTCPHFLLIPLLHPCETWQIAIQYSRQVSFMYFFNSAFTVFPFDTRERDPFL